MLRREQRPDAASGAAARQAAAGGSAGRSGSGERTRLLLLVFLLALAVRLAYQAEIHALPTQHQLVMDAQRYDALARSILDGGWRPREPFYQAPLYPYLLALLYAVSGRSLAAVRLAQALVGALTAVLAALAAGRLAEADSAGEAGPDRERHWQWMAATGGVLAALYAPAVFYTPLLLKTVPALFLESAALLALLPPAGRGLSRRRALLAGLLIGAAALLQESLLLLAPAAALFVTWWPEPAGTEPERRARRGDSGPTPPGRAYVVPGSDRAVPAPAPARRRRPGLGLALLAGAAIALAPAALLNLAAGGGLMPTSSQGGMNFYIGNARGATGTYSALSGGSQDPERQRADAQALAAAIATRERGRPVRPEELSPAEVSALFWRESGRQITAAPAAWARLMLRKARLFWNGYEIPDAEGFAVYRRQAPLLRADPVVFGLVAPLAAAGLLALFRGGPGARRSAALLALLAAATCAAVTLFFVFGRYRLAVVPFLLPLAAAGILETASSLAAVWRRGAAAVRAAVRGPHGPRVDGQRAAPTGAESHGPADQDAESRRPEGQDAEDWGPASQRASPGQTGALRRDLLPLGIVAVAALAVNLPCYSAAEVRQQDAGIEYNLGTAAVRQAAASYAEVQRQPPGAAAARRELAAALAAATAAVSWLDAAERDSPGFAAADLESATALARRGSYLANAGAFDPALADYDAARQRLAGLAGRPVPPTGQPPHQVQQAQADPELVRAAKVLLASLDVDTATALSNAGVRLAAEGRFDRAEALLDRATTLAPDLPAPRGSLALCWQLRALAARQRGAEAEARDLLRSSERAFRQAVRLAEAAGHTDQADLYRRGLATTTALAAQSPPAPPHSTR